MFTEQIKKPDETTVDQKENDDEEVVYTEVTVKPKPGKVTKFMLGCASVLINWY